MVNTRLVAGALAVVVTCLWAPATSAQQTQQPKKKYVATRAITIDAQTGALRIPNAEETQKLVDSLAALTNRSTEGLQATTLANGTKAVNLLDRFQSVILVRPNADGTSETKCVTTFEEAADFLGLVEDKSQQ